MPKTSEEQKAATRRRLVEAAVTVILRDGPGASTTRAIIDESGLSAGALYHYLPSKDALYAAIAQHFAENAGAMSSVGDDASSTDAIDHHVAVMAHVLEPDAHTIMGLLRVEAASSEAVATTLQQFDEIVFSFASSNNRRTQELGLFRSDVDAEALVEVIATFHEGLALRDGSGGYLSGRPRVTALFVEMLIATVLDHSSPHFAELAQRLRKITP